MANRDIKLLQSKVNYTIIKAILDFNETGQCSALL